MTLEEAELGAQVTVTHVGGEAGFRRRLMELGLLPGTSVSVTRIAPLGDPVELRVRGCAISIRRSEARAVRVGAAKPTAVRQGSMEPSAAVGLSRSTT